MGSLPGLGAIRPLGLAKVIYFTTVSNGLTESRRGRARTASIYKDGMGMGTGRVRYVE